MRDVLVPDWCAGRWTAKKDLVVKLKHTDLMSACSAVQSVGTEDELLNISRHDPRTMSVLL